MNWIFPWLLIIAVVHGAPASEAWKVATWNLRNYLDQNRWESGTWRFDYPKPEREKTAIRAVIREVGPDILLLQEIGTEAHLRELQDDLAAEGIPYAHRYFSIVDGARSGIALLSRFPPVAVHSLSVRDAGDEQACILRGVQEAVFILNGHCLRVYQVHLKSRYTTDPADPESRSFRRAEMALLAAFMERMSDLYAGTDTLLLAGDFNTPYGSPILDPLTAEWVPLLPAGSGKPAWTYHHRRTDKREVLDGFWSLREQPGRVLPEGVYPDAGGESAGSDHRMVVAEWRASP